MRKRQIGLVSATALVLGNMIGSGIFLLPASLAPYGGLSLIGWVISSVAALLLAGVFSRLSRRAPRTGGPYAYTREAFGGCIGFLVAWTYWVGTMAGSAAIAVAFGSYLSALFGAIGTNPLFGALVTLVAVWTLVAVNMAGVRGAGIVQVATTVLKLVPLLAIAASGLLLFNPRFLTPAPHAGAPLAAINASVAATLFAFMGVESASIPAGDVRNPERTIPRATLIGTAIAAAVYIACSAAVMGIVPGSELAKSQAPFAIAGRILWGGWAGYLVAVAAAVSCFGALNGWTLIMGQFPQAVARDGMFPKFLAKESARGTPVPALVVYAVFASVLVLANYQHGMVAMFTFVVLLSTLSSVVAYLFCAMADIVLARRTGQPLPPRQAFLACAAFAFCGWAVVGSGKDVVFWTFMLMVMGVPLYVWQTRHMPEATQAPSR